jgi:F-box and WD-40 domain protein 1/11
MALLDDLPTQVIADIVQRLHPRLYIDFIRYLPTEICLKILGYLDPISLITVAESCRSWYELAIDRKLWERLYYLEGWQAEVGEIEAAEALVNRRGSSEVGHLLRLQSSEDGHAYKKRPLSMSPSLRDEDYDMVMLDAEAGIKDEPMEMDASETSIFPDQARAHTGKTALTQHMRALDVRSSGSSSRSKGKEKAIDKSKMRALSPILKSDLGSKIGSATLWTVDERREKLRMNWKYLYSARRRLESNWERGRFVNFQFPHPSFPHEGHSECIYSLQFNAKYLVSGSRDRSIRIWDMRTQRLIRALKEHHGSVLCLQFDSDPDEDLIVSGSSDSDVILWKFSTGKVMQRLTHAHRESVLNVKFDKRILVTCSKDKTIKIFNRKALRPGDLGYREVNPVPRQVRQPGFDMSPFDEARIIQPYTMIGVLDGHGAAVNAVQIYEREVVSASGDRHVKVWDWPNQVCTRTIVGHTKGIACVQYDGRRIVSGSSDYEVKVFDRQTGLEVASLRSHSSLVRTVQAGFGDLPYSVDEDLEEAKRTDEEYFRAVQSGAVSQVPSRGRPGNAGSRRPEHITAYGAKLPPGGGGGRYGRIVSGSYDANIIIWRRDKDGVWMPQHRLRHESAALQARMGAAQQAQSSPQRFAWLPASLPPVRAADVEGGALAAAATQPARPPQNPPQMLDDPSPATAPPVVGPVIRVESPILATLTPQSIISYRSMIDTAVQEGPDSLAHILQSYPSVLTQREHLDAAIERETSPTVRAQLRQVAGTALMRTRYNQARQREAIRSLTAGTSGSHTIPGALPAAGPGPATLTRFNSAPEASTSQAGGNGGSSSSAELPGPNPPTIAVGPSGNGFAQLAATSLATQQSQPVVATSNHGHPPSQSSTGASNAVQNVPRLPAVTQHSWHTPNPLPPPTAPPATAPPATPTPAPAQAQLPLPPPPANANAQAAAHAAMGGHHHHPHIGGETAGAARVFKLQFDATRIICCSQTSVIVGWDFCNGDNELMEAARFFGTVD